MVVSQQPSVQTNDWGIHPSIHPSIAARGSGGHLIDADGRCWVDFLCAWGSNLLGYDNPTVMKAVGRQLNSGSNFGMPTSLGLKVADLLGNTVPCADQAVFGKNGSDVTAAAVRLARAVTGRELVLTRGYHGFHDWYLATDPDCPGIPGALRNSVDLLPLGDGLSALNRAFNKAPEKVAAVIVDPAAVPVLDGADLKELVAVSHDHGSLVIFDEVVTGFRLAPGGAQQYYGVTPDLACFGKAIANGFPLSSLTGNEALMRELPTIRFVMTFDWEAVSLAAADATISEIHNHRVCESLWETGRALSHQLKTISAQLGVEVDLIGEAPRTQVHFPAQGRLTERQLRWLFIQEMASRNILTSGIFTVCYAHTDDDIEQTADAFGHALQIVRQAIDRGSMAGLLHPDLAAAMRRLDNAEKTRRDAVLIPKQRGWGLSDLFSRYRKRRPDPGCES